MAKKSAGILLYRFNSKVAEFSWFTPEVLFSKKDIGVWSIPKGEFTEEEDALMAAKREFLEETGIEPLGVFTALTPIRQNAGKQVYAWAVNGDFDEKQLRSNHFEMEWPPKSGRLSRFPEIDKGGWFELDMAKEKIIPGQSPLLDELIKMLEDVTKISTKP